MARSKSEKGKKSEESAAGKIRPSWSGNLRFGLVSFSVQAFNTRAPERGGTVFHQLHAECHSRIRYEKHCPVHGAVGNDEIVSGYEYAKNKYVEIDLEELDELRTKRERSLTIDTFIGPDEIEPVYLEGRAYYLIPAGGDSRQAYGVFREALVARNRYGIGQVAFSNREHVVLVRPYEKLLLMQVLSYSTELRDVAGLDIEPAMPKHAAREVALAEQLIQSWTNENFDITRYADPFRQKVQELVEAKIKGREFVVPEEEEEPQVINLVDALRKSMGAGKKEPPTRRNGASASRRSRRSHHTKRRHAS